MLCILCKYLENINNFAKKLANWQKMSYNVIKGIDFYYKEGNAMTKANLKRIATVIAVMLVVMSISSVVYGASSIVSNPGDIKPENGTAVTKIENIAGIVLGAAQAIAVSVAVIMLVVLAIKYFAASPDGKAEIKKQATAYIIGAVLLFGGVGILQILQEFASRMN